jgi:hypothetical protein
LHLPILEAVGINDNIPLDAVTADDNACRIWKRSASLEKVMLLRNRPRSTLGFLARAAISLTLIVWLLSRVGVDEIVDRWKGVNPWILFLVVPAIHLVSIGRFGGWV